ncbi:MAG: response regulator transcription factor [Lachnospiraceae bacterium]|nr:response regulator transcription factor [Lachnospiraceae bacterium]MCM1278742.1 response regulator transcription factor [Robinsoniella sp.]
MIYLVEDDDNIRKLVKYALTKEGYEVTGFPSPKEFWEHMHSMIPELVLLDIMLPEEDGLSVLKKLKEHAETEHIPVIMLTAKNSEFDKVTGLDMGADDYVAKPFGTMELISRVRAVIRRYDKTHSKKIFQMGELYVEPAKHIILVSGKEIQLSYKEYLLLLVLLEAEGNVVWRDTLLTKVWGEYYTESRTLDVHIRKLRVKLGNAGRMIQTVKGIGYKMGGVENE